MIGAGMRGTPTPNPPPQGGGELERCASSLLPPLGGRVGEGDNPTHRSLWLTPLPALRHSRGFASAFFFKTAAEGRPCLPHKGGGSDAECPLAILERAAS
jgi:hypothetical protein